ncbi:hypothetical protein D623_10027166 [Myotis brandtii]|uniref:Uncharacterized protein n=1 Tax=Myotis brandtii TaxID=109478 RepID=S7N6H9_MYOBR|nr:hypothetical protein D623_10027166 [Myotis brandtii]
MHRQGSAIFVATVEPVKQPRLHRTVTEAVTEACGPPRMKPPAEFSLGFLQGYSETRLKRKIG